MIPHIFKLVWNRKWKSLLIMVEIFFSFIVLFWVSSVAIYSYRNYRSPLGFSMDKVYYLSLSSNEVPNEEVQQTLDKISSSLKSMPGISGVSFADDVPFVSWGSQESLEFNGLVDRATKWDVDEEFAKVMDIQLVKGRWFDKKDNLFNQRPVVITENVEKKFFGNNSAIGQVIISKDVKYKVVGVCKNVRDDALSVSPYGFFTGKSLEDTDSVATAKFLIKVKSGETELMDEKILSQARRQTKKTAGYWEVEGELLANKYSRQLSNSIFQFIIISIVWIFLLINVVLGLLGIFWLSINRRKAELGLRKAIGALNTQIYKQIIGEAFALTTLGILPALIIALQFPLLNILGEVPAEIYIMAIFVSLFLIYLLVGLSAFYPSRMASKIQPAFALHED